MVLRGRAFGRWVGHEDGALMNAVNALIKEIPKRPLATSTRWGQSEKKQNKTVNQEVDSPDHESASALILDFSASKTIV